MLAAVTVQSCLGRGDGPLDALSLPAPGTNGATELPQPLGDCSHPGVGLMQAFQGGLHHFLGAGRTLGRARQGELGLLAGSGRFLDLVRSLRDRALDLDQARRRGAAAPDETRGEDVAVTGDRRYPHAGGHHVGGSGCILHQCNAVQELLDCRSNSLRAGDHISGPDPAPVQSGQVGDIDRSGGGRDQQPCPTSIVLAQGRDGALGPLCRVHGQRIGCPAEGGGNPGLVSGLDLQQPRDRPHELIGAVPRR